MDEKTKLLIALNQVDNLVKLTEDNHWKNYISGHLNIIHLELERQLELLTHDEKNTKKD